MAFTFKNAKLVLTTTPTDVYTVPASTRSIIISAAAVNVHGSSTTVEAQWTDNSDGNAITRLAYGLPIAKNGTESLLIGKLVLETGDKFKASCATPNAVEITLSIMEIT